MKPLTEEQIRAIVQDEMRKNYMSGSPDVPPHSHNGTDGLNISPADLIGWSNLPSSLKIYTNPIGAGFISSLVINAAGTGYVVGDIVSISGSIENATAIVTSIGGGGSVTGINIVRGGNGYLNHVGVITDGGTGTGLTLNTTTSGLEYGFSSIINLLPASSTNGEQIINNPNISQYSIPIVVGNGRISGKPQGEFQGGYSPDGTLIGFINGVTVDLYLRFEGRWYGVNMADII